MNKAQMIAIIRARQALFAAAETGGCDADIASLHSAARTMLEVERAYPELQAEAFAAIAGPREEWEIA